MTGRAAGLRWPLAAGRRGAATGRKGRVCLRDALAILLLTLFATLANPSSAQSPETFEIGLSTQSIAISSDFSGASLVIFGALDNADPKILRQGGYNIVVALEGPRRPLVVRQKERVLGLWINRQAESFEQAPASYSMAATRRIGDVAPGTVLRQLSIGVDDLRLAFDRKGTPASPARPQFEEALRRIKVETGLYNQTFGTVEFVSSTLFRAELILPADLPVGRHLARAFLFKQGGFIREDSEPLLVVKVGLENYIHEFATRHGFLYGVFAVFLAMFTGWLGRVIFKRD